MISVGSELLIDTLEKGFRAMQAEIRIAMRDSVRAAGVFAQHEARATKSFKDKTGDTRSSIKKWGPLNVEGGFAGGVKAGKIAGYLNDGTGLWGPKRAKYPIVPVRAAFLVFMWNGRLVFAKKVMHPGVKPRKFMQNAQVLADRFLEEDFAHRLDRLVETFNSAAGD